MTILLEKKYIPLSHYFQAATNPSIRLTFSEIEQIMGQNLPNAAYLNKSWWKKSKPPAKHFHAWMDAGYRVTEVEPDRYVVFEKADAKNTAAGTDEEDFMLYGKDERSLSTQRVRKQIIEWKQSGHSAIIIAILNGQHVGYLMVIGNEAKRAQHRAALVLGLLKEAQGKGIAKSLLEKAEDWAKQKGITRLELTVIEDNERARKLYEKAGFEAEGTRHRSLIIDGKEHDEIYLAKFLD